MTAPSTRQFSSEHGGKYFNSSGDNVPTSYSACSTRPPTRLSEDESRPPTRLSDGDSKATSLAPSPEGKGIAWDSSRAHKVSFSAKPGVQTDAVPPKPSAIGSLPSSPVTSTALCIVQSPESPIRASAQSTQSPNSRALDMAPAYNGATAANGATERDYFPMPAKDAARVARLATMMDDGMLLEKGSHKQPLTIIRELREKLREDKIMRDRRLFAVCVRPPGPDEPLLRPQPHFVDDAGRRKTSKETQRPKSASATQRPSQTAGNVIGNPGAVILLNERAQANADRRSNSSAGAGSHVDRLSHPSHGRSQGF